jgi:serine/threonine protein kinase
MPKSTNSKSKNKKGGKVLASGGFGCVFRPALRCAKSTTRKRGQVSKLMTAKHATKEYDEITQFKELLHTIHNYSDYFLLDDITMCKPSELTQSDLTNFKQKCKALPKDNITYTNVNDSLDNLLVLNMPDGGIPVDDFIFEAVHFNELYNLNKSLIRLLKHGIVPMNKKHVYHCDVKDSNILVSGNESTLKTRLIDWGLSTLYIPFKNDPMPRVWVNRPFQYNVPFSVIIFSNAFVDRYTDYIDNNGQIDENGLKPFVSDYIDFWMHERGHGHYKLIDTIIHILLDKKYTLDTSSSQNTRSIITDYIIEILINFTRFRADGTLNLREYLDKVFVNNVDVWGFVSTYLPLLENLHENYANLTPVLHDSFHIIRNLFLFLYSPSVKPLNKDVIVKELTKLGKLFKSEMVPGKTNKSQISLVKSESMSKGITGKTFVPDNKLETVSF